MRVRMTALRLKKSTQVSLRSYMAGTDVRAGRPLPPSCKRKRVPKSQNTEMVPEGAVRAFKKHRAERNRVGVNHAEWMGMGDGGHEAERKLPRCLPEIRPAKIMLCEIAAAQQPGNLRDIEDLPSINKKEDQTT